jgi:hypothetical protein
LGNILFSVHIPVHSESIELWEEERYIRLNNEINRALLTASLLLENFCKLIFLTTCSMPPSKHRHIWREYCFPILCTRRSCNGRDVFFNELEQCLFWNLSGESAESFLQIIRDVGPTVYSQTRRGDRRQIHFYFPFPLLSELTTHFEASLLVS